MDNYLSFKAIKYSTEPTPKSSYTKATFGLFAYGVDKDSFPKLEYSNDKETWHAFDIGESYDVDIDKVIYLRNGLTVKVEEEIPIKEPEESTEEDEDIVKTKTVVREEHTEYVNNTFSLDADSYFRFEVRHGYMEVSGNVMSLIDYTEDITEIPNDYCFNSLFLGNHDKLHFKDITLPATELRSYCYVNMFADSAISEPISLEATELKEGCYAYMFKNCINLNTTMPLNADTLKESCYKEMFRGCIKLNTIADIKATELANDCYRGMFKDCISLEMGPELVSLKVYKGCYEEMFCGCKSLREVPRIMAKQSSLKLYSLIFTKESESGVPEVHSFPCYGDGEPLLNEINVDGWIDDYNACISDKERFDTIEIGLATDPYVVDGLCADNWNTHMFHDCPSLLKIEVASTKFLKHNTWISGSTVHSGGVFGVPNSITESDILQIGVPCPVGAEGYSNWSIEVYNAYKSRRKKKL